MSELRVKQSARWGVVPEALLEDLSLGLDSRAVAAWLAARPDGWQVRIDPLCRRLGVGRDRWRRISAELLAGGYLARARIRLGDGRVGWRFDFCPHGSLNASNEAPPTAERKKVGTPADVLPQATKKSVRPRALSQKEIESIELEIEAANRAAARGERKPVSHPGFYRRTLADQIRSGTFEPSTAALDLASARRAEAERQARLTTPPSDISRPAKTIPPAAALAQIRAAIGLPAITSTT